MTSKSAVLNVIKQATSVEARNMFKAQFLATALSAHSNVVGAHLLQAQIQVGEQCKAVGSLLTEGNALFASPSATRDALLALKDVYDAINNNRATVCGPIS